MAEWEFDGTDITVREGDKDTPALAPPTTRLLALNGPTVLHQTNAW